MLSKKLTMTLERDRQSVRAVQVGLVMRAYRESFMPEGGRKGLTQEELLQRMSLVDDAYEERFSHTTVSRWESGATRPSVRRLQAFGKALNLKQTEVAGLILLAGLAPDYSTALLQAQTGESAQPDAHGTSPQALPRRWMAGVANEDLPSFRRNIVRLLVLRVLPTAVAITAAAFALWGLGLEETWTPVLLIGFAIGLVLILGFAFTDPYYSFRDFFWVSIFFLLSTPLLQFAPIRMDYYNFHVIDGLTTTIFPFMLALLTNLLIASCAGVLLQVLRRWQWEKLGDESGAFQRAAWVVVPPMVLTYAVVAVLANASVSIQLAAVFPAVAVGLTIMVALEDPLVRPSERDRQFLFWTLVAAMVMSVILGIATILAIYLSPNIPMVMPDHNLLRSWEIDFARYGFTREEALDLLNLGYIWHATIAFGYGAFVMGIKLILAVYRMAEDPSRSP